MATTISLKVACNYLGVSRTTMLAWARTGRVKAYRLGSRWRFYEADLDAALKDGVVAQKSPPAKQQERGGVQ